MSAPEITVGTTLPPLTIDATPTFVVATALATRDFQDVHHDRDLAQAKGSKDIFVNILTDTGLVERFVTDWAGPSARITSIKLRLGVPWYAYDTLTFTGEVVALASPEPGGSGPVVASRSPEPGRGTSPVSKGDSVTVAVTGTNSLGKHVRSTVTFTLEADR